MSRLPAPDAGLVLGVNAEAAGVELQVVVG